MAVFVRNIYDPLGIIQFFQRRQPGNLVLAILIETSRDSTLEDPAGKTHKDFVEKQFVMDL